MMENRIDALLADEEFAAKLEKIETIEDAVALFAQEDVTVTVEELNGYLNDAQGNDLSEDDLDDVSGGCIICVGVRIIRGIINSRKRSSGGGGKGAFGGGGGGGGGRF